MDALFKGRHAARIDGPFVAFIIGMRINRVLAVHKWVPVARAMGPMVAQLMARPELGLLHADAYVYWRGVAMLQYWRSFDHLERFSREPELAHLDAWRRFNGAVGGDGSVGIWHETFVVGAGQCESVYVNMPRRGLAMAGELAPAVGPLATARRRLQPEPRAAK
jgi:hypothetical protein